MNIIPNKIPASHLRLTCPLNRPPGHLRPVLAVFLRAAGSLAVSYDGCQVVEWSCDTGAELRRFELPGLFSICLSLSVSLSHSHSLSLSLSPLSLDSPNLKV
jgi:hypothetical protein